MNRFVPAAPALHDFTHNLLEVVNLLPEDWPHVHASEYGPLRRHLHQRIEVMYDLIKQHPQCGEEEIVAMRWLGESALHLVDVEWRKPSSFFEASPAFLEYGATLPEFPLQEGRLFCTPDTTERRIHHILQDIESDGRILFLGDDGLGSLALAQQFSGEIHVFAHEQRVLTYIQEQAPQVQCHTIDLVSAEIPHSLQTSFDAVVLDPPWDSFQAWCFLRKALLCLKQSPHARIYLSFCPIHVEYQEKKAQRFFRRFAREGLTFEAIYPAFNLYPLAHTKFLESLLPSIPAVESPLLSVLQTLPFAFSHFYTLRRTEHFHRNPIRRWFSQWWHSRRG